MFVGDGGWWEEADETTHCLILSRQVTPVESTANEIKIIFMSTTRTSTGDEEHLCPKKGKHLLHSHEYWWPSSLTFNFLTNVLHIFYMLSQLGDLT